MQQEIERLRLSQAEKQLELKEAATRRRLWELKQQLLQSSTSQTTPPPATSTTTATSTATAANTATAARISYSQPTAQPTRNAAFPQSHSPVQSYPHSTHSFLPHSQSLIQSYGDTVSNRQRHASKPPHTAPQQLKHTLEGTSHMPSESGDWLVLSVDGRDSARARKCAEEENPADFSSQMKDPKTRLFLQPTHTQDVTHGVNENIGKHTETTQLNPSRTFEAQPSLFHAVAPTESRTVSHGEDTSQEGHTHLHSFKHIPTNSPASQHSPQKDTSSTHQKVIPQPNLHSSKKVDDLSPPPEERKTQLLQKRQRLTLPDEIKETEYMSAVQRQRARVSRIRRCIAAATVIQRAWREHRETLS